MENKKFELNDETLDAISGGTDSVAEYKLHNSGILGLPYIRDDNEEDTITVFTFDHGKESL